MDFFSKKKKDDEFILNIENEQMFKIHNINVESKSIKSVDALTPDEVLDNKQRLVSSAESTGALEALKKRLTAVAERGADFNEPSEINEVPEKASVSNLSVKPDKKVSLLDKCMPYILDENGKEVVDSKPIYKLQSVADILKADSEKTIERLSQKYDIAFDNLGYTPNIAKTQKTKNEEEKPKEEESKEKKSTVPDEKLLIRNIQSNVPFVISDIDIPEIKIEEPMNKDISNTATITFTPVSNGDSGTSHISVSSQTRPIDLTGELVRMPETIEEKEREEIQLENNEFEDFVPNDEYTPDRDGAKLIRKLFIKKRRAFLQTVLSIFLTLILVIAKIPAVTEVLYVNIIGNIICTCLVGIITIINLDIFVSFARVFRRDCKPDSFVAFASLFTLGYLVFSLLKNNVSVDMIILLAVILSFRALTKFLKASYMISNLKTVSSSGEKSAVRFISDNAVTFAMAKNSIEGDVLIAAPKKVSFVEDYMKYSSFGVILDGKLRIITVVSLLLSAIIGFACAFYFDGLIYGLYAAAAIQCFTALPTVFLIDNLPLYAAAKKLNRKNAMIAGKTGAEYTEMANAIVLNARDIFPSGTVTLQQIKVLSENDLQDTIIRAASLTENLSSTLAPIFKKIAGTSDIMVLPDSDTVKYEDKMGISGWVDNRLLFIGNRTLMEAHGIDVPPLEVDRKILRSGYFPVYVATGDKACAMLVIQYNVDAYVARELRRLTSAGVTLLINSSDQNLTEEMICDYLGLYDDSVKVMTAAGCHMYNNSISEAESISAPAAYKGSTMVLATVMNCALKIKRANLLLTILHIISLVLGVVLFAYTSLSGSGNLMSETSVLVYTLISTIASYLIYLTSKP